MKQFVLGLFLLFSIGEGLLVSLTANITVITWQRRQLSIDNPYIQVLDSCEYICRISKITHKGNCKFCRERGENELKELVEQLKKK